MNGGWSEGTEVSQSATCGDITINTSRVCNNPLPYNGGENCAGEATYTVQRSLAPCPGKTFFYSICHSRLKIMQHLSDFREFITIIPQTESSESNYSDLLHVELVELFHKKF